METIDLFIRPLNPLGIPIRDASFVDKTVPFASRDINLFSSADITEILPGGRRFVVYVKSHTYSFGETLLLRKVDSATNIRLGEAIVLYRTEQIYGNVKIDPRGRFIIFGGSGDLSYLALDSEGHPSGNLKYYPILEVPRLIFSEKLLSKTRTKKQKGRR
jgi:hypothetical protein